MTSSYSMTAGLRQSITLLQAELTRAQQEVATGRRADLADSLGVQLSQSFTTSTDEDVTAQIIATNQVVSSNLASTQNALASLSDVATAMRNALIPELTNPSHPEVLADQARQSLSELTAALNTKVGDTFIFGGINTASAPLADYRASPPSPNTQALDAAFFSAFGVSQMDPAVSDITPTQIESFLSNGFANLFSAAQWKANWSSASDATMTSQINYASTIDSSVSANDGAFQKLAAAYTMMSDLGSEKMDKATYAAVAKTAVDDLNVAIDGLAKSQAQVGLKQSAVNAADAALKDRSAGLETRQNQLESVDPADAATRVNALMTQIETAYTLTAQLHDLTLSKYL